jgi:hypothetical protein
MAMALVLHSDVRDMIMKGEGKETKYEDLVIMLVAHGGQLDVQRFAIEREGLIVLTLPVQDRGDIVVGCGGGAVYVAYGSQQDVQKYLIASS